MNIEEVYEYIKQDNREKVSEYLNTLPPLLYGKYIGIVNSLLHRAIDYKRVEIVKQIVTYYNGDPRLTEYMTKFYTLTSTLENPSIELYKFLFNGSSKDQDTLLTDLPA